MKNFNYFLGILQIHQFLIFDYDFHQDYLKVQ